ncbi:MAG: GMC family oxidoreductase N-terminal domain-containing protein, partial [Solirubrobacterales bacterium]
PEPVDVVAALEPFLATLPRRSVATMRLALRAFEWMPFPWRFSRASLAGRQDFLRRVENSGSALKRDLLLFLKVLAGLAYGNDPRVQRAVGYEIRCAVSGPAAATAAADGAALGDLTPSGPEEVCDIVVVGSGAGGAVAAALLAEAGLEVAVLEAGPYLDRHTYPDEPLAALQALYRDGGLTVAAGRPAIPTPVGRAVGGTTVINSGTCFRAPESLLADWAADHGIEWATKLDPDYAQGEEMLAVKPVDPETMGRNGQLLLEGAEALGVSHAPLHRNAGDCVQCSSCPNGCRLDAKRAMHVSYLPRAVAAGARVRAGVEAQRVVFERGRAVAVDCYTGSAPGDGVVARAFRVRARRAVVLAGGAFGTPELLLRSGFGSPSGELGRNLRIHPACWVGARFEEPVRGWDGVMQSYAVDEWEESHGVLLEATFTPLAFGGQWLPGTGIEHQRRLLDYGHLASTGVHLSDRSSGRVRLGRNGSLRIGYQLTREDSVRLSFGIARAAELFYAAGATEVYPQISGVPTIPRERVAELDTSPPPRSRLRLEAFHPMGTARMDADPARGVVATDGAVHGAEALYVADASLLPSSIGVNPMMTIIAMASRVARQMADALA